MTKQAESLPSSPEELLRYLETSHARTRSARENAQRSRAAFLVSALLILVVGAVASLMFLFSMLQDRPRGESAQEQAEQVDLPFAPTGQLSRS
jgi:multidrug resistance efflux pump